MPYFKYTNIEITGLASAVPANAVPTDSFIPLFGEEAVRQFQEMTGILEFRKTRPEQTASDLGFVAAERLLSEQALDRESIGILIFVSHSTDYRRPGTAFVLHKRLGLGKECFAFDVGLGCSGFVAGVNLACSLLQNSDRDRALVIVAETVSKLAYPEDKSTAMAFGDAGSAILLGKTDKGTALTGLFRSDGNQYKSIIVPAGGFRNLEASAEPRVWADGNTRTLYNTHVDGTAVFQFILSDVIDLVKEYMEKTASTVDDYDCFVFHQTNEFHHKQIARKLKIPMEKMQMSMKGYGNTSGPSIPLTLCDKYGQAADSDIRALLCGFGVGFSWGALAATLKTGTILPVVETDDYFAEGIINGPEDF